jgi:hypothetical protein
VEPVGLARDVPLALEWRPGESWVDQPTLLVGLDG